MEKNELASSLAIVFLLSSIITTYTILYDPTVLERSDRTSIADLTFSKTTVKSILQNYEKDFFRSNLAYKDKIWEVSGTIVRIEKNWFGQPVIRLKGNELQAGEISFIFHQEEDRVSNWNKGDEVSIRGIGKGKSPRYGIKFKNCIFSF